MTERVPTPPFAEMMRQRHIHGLRMSRVGLVRRLQDNNFDDADALSKIIYLNGQIDVLKRLREPYPDYRPEPTVEDITARGLDWYWEEWREDADTSDDEEAEDA